MRPFMSHVRTHARTTTAALVLAVALAGCSGSDDESASTTSGPSSSTPSEDERLATDAEAAFKKFWAISQTKSPSEPPTSAQKEVMTEEAYQRQVEFAEAAPPVAVKGKDKLTATSVKTKRSTAGATATIEVCYTVHRRLLLTEDVQQDGKTLKKGKDIRTDQDGKSIKAGTEMVNLVTMERGPQDDDQWKVDSTKVGHKKQCTIERGTP